MARWTRRGFLAAGLSLAGCAVPGRPPLGPIYRPTRGNVDQPPLVVIPGAFGSSLRNRGTGREIWPGTNPQLLMSNYRGLELDIDPATLEPLAGDVEAYDIFREGLGRDFYGKVVDMLHDAGGYAHGKVGEPPVPGRRSYFVYLYDWRLDNVAAARGLHELIEQIRRRPRRPAAARGHPCPLERWPAGEVLRALRHGGPSDGRAIRAHRSGRRRHSPPAARRDAEPRHHAARARKPAR